MAQRRMFSLEVVDTDEFLECWPQPSAFIFTWGCVLLLDLFLILRRSQNGELYGGRLEQLTNRRYIIPFDSGIVVIKDWKVNNYIQKDGYTPTRYQKEKQRLSERNKVHVICIEEPC